MIVVIDNIVLIVASLVTVALFVLWIYSFRYMVRYSIENGDITVKLFGMATVRRIRTRDIVEVFVITWRDLIPFTRSFRPGFLLAERWGGYTVGRGVAIKKRRGVIRRLIIAPENPEAFVRMIRTALGERGSRKTP